MSRCFVKNSTGVLKKVLLCPPNYMKLQPINVIADKWIKENNGLNIEKCIKEHNDLIKAYEENGVEVVLMKPEAKLTNEVFARDFGGCIREGYILGNFKEPIRYGETIAYKSKMEELGIPCVAKVSKGYFEGGDFWFLDDNTLAIGVIARTDETAIIEINDQISKFGYEIIPVKCSEENLHLDMCFNIVDEKIAVACKATLPDSFLRTLEERDFKLIDIPQEGVFKHHCNLQALGNKRVISLKSNVEVNRKLKELGIKVIELDLEEVLKSGGGPHCMTFPLERI
ncbi:nitrate reductase [Clostridium tyrobutyricum]|uniref:NG,NG-dimethylarginine dimethylaminohydrolase 1 n=1 Tax=Clostridium tyrobutyricum DIVETGP TaxID=1408889 RepID=W6N4D3_CLOTY|nr:arginine deiminase family protein [Clostridium tyrobutyricum]AND83590.1 amino acid ABC transporter, permease protein [Clostridium tyrobutyricum]ANP68368.1 nitrate reductase [Clostridium tyrobutyricum]MBV4433111.1 nitrate reductase [Clostridium tyrobutyricum]MBV4449456.1 nitrate reductase [Clostridium tyrobutyricum]MCH4199839.1 arginine deiminase family protein [Clostridium tyrobutyricum]